MVCLFMIQKEMKLIMTKYNIPTLLGFLLVLFIIYFRFLKERLPTTLLKEFSYMEKTFFLCMILIFFSLTFYYLYLFYLQIMQKPLYIKRTLFLNISQFYWKCLLSFDDFIKHTLLVKYLPSLLLTVQDRINYHFVKLKSLRYLLIYLIVDIFPKCIVLICFSVDIYKYQFNFIYKSIWFLLIPLIFKYILFTLREYSEQNLSYMLDNILSFKFHSGELMTLQDLLDSYNGANTQKDFYSNSFDNFNVHAINLSDKQLQICLDTNDDIDETIVFYSKQFNSFAKLRTIITQFDSIYKTYNNIFSSLRFYIYCYLWLQVYTISLNLFSSFFVQMPQDIFNPFV